MLGPDVFQRCPVFSVGLCKGDLLVRLHLDHGFGAVALVLIRPWVQVLRSTRSPSLAGVVWDPTRPSAPIGLHAMRPMACMGAAELVGNSFLHPPDLPDRNPSSECGGGTTVEVGVEADAGRRRA